MKKLILPIAFIMLLITSCKTVSIKNGEEIDNKAFYNIPNIKMSLAFQADKENKSTGIMNFTYMTEEGYVTTDVYYTYQIVDSIINIHLKHANKGVIADFNQFNIKKGKDKKINSLITVVNGTTYFFMTKESIGKLNNITE